VSALLLLLAGVGAARADTVRLVLRERGSGALVDDPWAEVAGVHTEGADGVVTLQLDDGTWTVRLGAPLHQPLDVPVEVPGPAEVQVFLLADLAPPEIVVEARRPSPHVSRQILDKERVEQTPGAFDDPIRLIQSLPGVAVTPEFGSAVGEVAIRGAAPSESRFYVDGVELPYLYHFDQYASVVPIRVLDEVAVYPSGFGPAFGDVAGAVVDARTSQPDTERAHGGVDLNFIMAGAHLSVPVSDTVAVSASARRSYLDLAESSNDQYTVWPIFYDFTTRVDWTPGADHDLALIALGAGDGYSRYAGDVAALDPLQAESEDVFSSDRDFQAVMLHDRVSTESLVARTVFSLVADRWIGTLSSASQARRELQLGLRHDTTLTLGPHSLALGADGIVERVDLAVSTDRAWPELGGEAPLLDQGVPLDERRSRLAGGAFVEPRLQLDVVGVQPGVRVQVDDSVASPVALDPRLTVQAEPAPDLRLRGAIGRYSQAPEAEDRALREAEGGAPLSWIRAEHAVLGADVAIAGRWEIGVEGWGRWLQDAVVLDADAGVQVVDGQALGVELTSRYRMRERFFSSLAVTLGRARRGDAVFAYDQPFALNMLASWDFRRGWNAGFRWRYATGLPYTPVVDASYDGDSDSYLPITGDPYSERLSDYQKFDLHLQRDLSWRTFELSLYFELWWVPAANNTLYAVYSYDYSEQAFVRGPPLVPLLGLRAGF